MSGGRTGRRGARWPLFAALAVVAALTVAGASVMAERSLLERSNEAEGGVEALVAEAVAPALKGVDPARQVDPATAQQPRRLM